MDQQGFDEVYPGQTSDGSCEDLCSLETTWRARLPCIYATNWPVTIVVSIPIHGHGLEWVHHLIHILSVNCITSPSCYFITYLFNVIKLFFSTANCFSIIFVHSRVCGWG